MKLLQAEKTVLHKKAVSVLRDMHQSNHALTISLEAFTQDEIETLVTAVLDQPNPERLARVIWEITAGWPLYAEQVSHTADLTC